MPRIPSNLPLLPSVLDRLVSGSATWGGPLLDELKESVRRDLENLLNTRWCATQWPSTLRELETSLVNYGIPDFAGNHFGSPLSKEEFRRIVEQAIRNFEPRFHRVNVELVGSGETGDRTLRLRIRALLRVEPNPKPVVFDSILEPLTGACKVNKVKEGGAGERRDPALL